MQTAQDRTGEAVRQQASAMGAGVFEIGLFKPDAADGEPVMVPRVWDTDALLRSVPWLRNQNREGRNIYIRLKGEHDLSLVDDLSRESLARYEARRFHSGGGRRDFAGELPGLVEAPRTPQ